MEQDFEWDYAKCVANIAKHKIDFQDAIRIFSIPHVAGPSPRKGEDRLIAVGELEGAIITVVYTVRGNNLRIISARRARKNEAEKYRQSLGRQLEEGKD